MYELHLLDVTSIGLQLCGYIYIINNIDIIECFGFIYISIFS